MPVKRPDTESRNPPGAGRKVLLTGATGFLGAHLLCALLEEPRLEVVCLVRGRDQGEARARLDERLARLSPPAKFDAGRVEVLCGDLQDERFGLSAGAYEDVRRSVDAVYHCAGLVDWAAPYETLERVNVAPLPALLRLAQSARRKRFHLVSSASVCYLAPGSGRIAEDARNAVQPDRLRLPYARSKWAAEQLVEEASRRGLAAQIYRPSIILGDSRSGQCNPSDIVARMLKACVGMRLAPDVELVLDYCPVDFVARAIVALSRARHAGLRTFHLLNPFPARWSELVLWLNLYGYDIRLAPHVRWLERLAQEVRAPRHPLRPLRRFFFERRADVGGLTLFETYEDGRASVPDDRASARRLARLGLACPALDAQLIERYVHAMISGGQLPAPDAPRPRQLPADGFDRLAFEPLLRSAFGDAALRVGPVEPLARTPRDGLTSSLAAWKYGAGIGVHRYALGLKTRGRRAQRLAVIVKVKPFEHELRGAIVTAARLCSERLAAAFETTAEVPGFSGSTQRELAVYGQGDARFVRHAPRAYGTLPQRDARPALMLEDLGESGRVGRRQRLDVWPPAYVAAAVRGIAQVHAVWYGREAELLREPWLGAGHTLRGMLDARELWHALADFARPAFVAWAGAEIGPLAQGLAGSLEAWWPEIESQTRSLIHNDFNPRNLAFRDTRAGPRLCAFDWELATLGLPQRDVAELLCFVLEPRRAGEAAGRYLELHREALQRASGRRIERGAWRAGFGLALRELLLTRLPMYALMHRFRRQDFLPRVLAAWHALYRWQAAA
jgi:thioester reductase-like protein